VETAEYSSGSFESAGSKWHIADQALITERDAVSAQLQADGNGKRAVMLKLSEEASAKLQNATAANIGKPIVIFLNGSILSTPYVNSEFGGKILVIRFSDEGLTEAEANAIIGAVENRR
jgi:preprotein translocase subunit SecD